MYQIFLLVASVVLLLLLISKLRLHTFLSLLLISLLLGIAGGLPLPEVAQHIAEGFGAIMQGIGIVIVAGVIIGEILEVTGGAKKIANSIIKLVGPKNATPATAVTGGIVSLSVFCDAGFVILNPAIKALSRAGKIPYMCLVSALMMGLLATHSLVPPTPGPIAAAGILGADLGMVMIYSVLVSIPVILITGIFWCNSKFIKNKFPDLAPVDEADEAVIEDSPASEVIDPNGPSLLKSLLPILIPIALIVIRSFALQYAPEDAAWLEIVSFLGTPYIALLIGVAFSFLVPKKITGEVTETWVSRAVMKSAEIVTITGIAGGFGRILQNIGIGDALAELVTATNLPAIMLPFIISMLVLLAQGSATVALTTASAIIYPLLPSLGISPELAVISIAGGSFTGVLPSGSYFWAVTKLAGYDIKKGYFAVTITTFVMGAVALASIFILSMFVS